MSAVVVYDGVPGARGVLFQGKKFFVAMRIPNRPRIIGLITQNGGTIAKLEKQADFIIADHARNDCPPDSLSWQFIIDSAEYGAIQEEDKYEISHSPAVARAVGSSKPTKGTRTQFTNTDDAVLAKWVRKSRQTSGNEIYKALESINTRHTWQSWRNRWVNKLSKLSSTALENLAASAPDDTPGEPSGAATLPKRSTPAIRSKTPVPAAQPAARARPAAGKPIERALADTAKGVKFTSEDDNLLLQSVEECRRRGGRLDNSPVRNELMDQPSANAIPGPGQVLRDSSGHQNDTSSDSLDTLTRRTQSPQVPLVAGAKGSQLEPGGTPEIKNEEDENGLVETDQATVDVGNPDGGGEESGADVEEDEGDGSQGITRDDFYWRLKRFREVMGQDGDTEPQIAGQNIDLWLLWKTIRDIYARGLPEVDWDVVAVDLGLPREASDTLQRYYSEEVQSFVDLLHDDDDEDNSDKGNGDDKEAEIQPDHADQDVGSDGEDEVRISLPPSTPVAASRKRPGTQSTDHLVTVGGRAKRQRLGPDDEVPSTPEERLGFANPDSILGSPSLSVKKGPRQTFTVQTEEHTGSVSAKPRRLEPETQDFGFDDEDHAIEASRQPQEGSKVPSPATPSLDKANDNSPRRSKPASPHSVPGFPAEPSRLGGDEEAEPESQETARITALDNLIDRFVNKAGYRREDVLNALMSTSLCTSLTPDVLKYMSDHGSIPSNWEGVWTERDDERLRRVDSVSLESGANNAQRAKVKKYWDLLVRKHTQNRVEQRREFLMYMEETRQNSQ